MTLYPERFPVRFRPWHAALIFACLYLLLVYLPSGDPLAAFVRPGEYDGQFSYALALDPVHPPNLDDPAYRYQRILLPVLARFASLGQRVLLPWALLAINVAALVAGVALLEALLVERGASRWYALVYGLFGGTLFAAQLLLNEPLSFALVLGGFWLAERDRLLGAAGAFGLALLAKETALPFAGAYGLYLLFHRRWREAALFGVITGGVFLLWHAALYWRFGSPGFSPYWGGLEVLPLWGLWRVYAATGSLQVFLVVGVPALLMAYLPAVWGVYRSGRDLLARRWPPEAFLLLAVAGFALFLPYTVAREPFGVMRVAAGLVIAVLLYAARVQDRRALRYSAFWLLTLLVALAG